MLGSRPFRGTDHPFRIAGSPTSVCTPHLEACPGLQQTIFVPASRRALRSSMRGNLPGPGEAFPDLPGLDPGTVAAAPTAGVPEDQLRAMSRYCRPTRLGACKTKAAALVKVSRLLREVIVESMTLWGTELAPAPRPRRRYSEAHARALLLLAASDQGLVDSVGVGIGVSFGARRFRCTFAKYRPPESSAAQHTRILDARWISVAVARIKERESFIEVRRKLGNNRPPGPNEDQNKAKTDKGNGKGPKEGRGSGESDQQK